MPDRITTHEQAIAAMLEWANGERSHWNAIADGAGAEGAQSPGAQWASCILADAAEVQKWAAVAGALLGRDADALPSPS